MIKGPSAETEGPFCIAFPSAGRRQLQSYNAGQQQRGEKHPGRCGRLLKDQDPHRHRAQRTDARPDGIGCPQRQCLERLGKEEETGQHPHDRQCGLAQPGKPLRELQRRGPNHFQTPRQNQTSPCHKNVPPLKQKKALAPRIFEACRCMGQTPFIHPAADEPYDVCSCHAGKAAGYSCPYTAFHRRPSV